MKWQRQARDRGLLSRLAVSATIAIVAAAATVTGLVASASGGTLTAAMLGPFTGPDAALGPVFMSGCLPAAREVDAHGGVMGSTVTCKAFDTRGDPADAIPAADQMIASTKVMAAEGCTSDEAIAVVPIMEHAHIPSFCFTGQSEFNKSSFHYFHRMVPADEYEAYAMAGIAVYHYHFKRIALVFGNDIGSQAFVPPLKKVLPKLGAKVVISQTLALGQPSYQTEVDQLIQAKPQVIISEALGTTEATYVSELKQLHGMLPVIVTSGTVDPQFLQGMAAAIGAADLYKYFTMDDFPPTFSGPAYAAYKSNLLATTPQNPTASQYLRNTYAEHSYDGIILTALAMTAAKSTDGSVYNPWIKKIANGVKGAKTVYTYQAGIAALKAGKSIRYVGAGGATHFDQWNNSNSGYIIVKWTAKGAEKQIGVLTQAQTNKMIAYGNA